jgi:hypothetical protein
MSEHDGHSHIDLPAKKGPGLLQFVPYFLLVLVLYILGEVVGADPKAVHGWGNYTITWGEFLLILSAVLSLAEQMKVSHPGTDNTLEALIMVGMGVVQLVLFVLGAAGVAGFAGFAKSDFLVLTFISLAAAIVAVLINARTLKRSIGFGEN